jgi:hypothetical protein
VNGFETVSDHLDLINRCSRICRSELSGLPVNPTSMEASDASRRPGQFSMQPVHALADQMCCNPSQQGGIETVFQQLVLVVSAK